MESKQNQATPPSAKQPPFVHKRKRSSFRRQRTVLLVLAVLTVVLALSVPLVNYLVSISSYTDYDGAVYYAKRVGGSWGVYDADGARLSQNDDGRYLTVRGTQLTLSESGRMKEYAVVHTEGLEIAGTQTRVLMFAQIRQSDIASIAVTNRHGSYTFYTDATGTVLLKGFEGIVTYDPQAYASLAVAAGYPLTLQRLDRTQTDALGFSEYGLAPEVRVDEHGQDYTYEPARYTVTAKDGTSHTVLVGDAIVSGEGYYCKLDGEHNRTVYIMSATNFEASLLQPIERLISPVIVYPMTDTTFYNVDNFIISHADENDPDEQIVDVAFRFVSFLERENTMYAGEPYEIIPKYFKYKYSGYLLNPDSVSAVLQSLVRTNFVGVSKLGVSDDDLARYGLDQPAHVMHFDFLVDKDGNGVTETAIPQLLYISRRTENDTYHVYAPAFNIIAEVSRSSLYYLDYETIDWIYPYVVWHNIAFVRSITVRAPDTDLTFTLDNSASDQSGGIDSKGLRIKINGVEPDYIVYKVSANTGAKTPETPVYNFRQFYKALMYTNISGMSEDGHIALTEEQMAALRALDDSECQLVLTIHAEDYAATANPTYHDENNTSTQVLRFYRYSEGRSYLTINGEGEFFVDAAFVEKLIADAKRVQEGILVDALARN